MRITDFKDKAARTKLETNVSFEELMSQIINSSPVAYKEDLRWFKLGAYGDHIENPASGCLRTNANFVAASGAAADYDLEEMTLDEAADVCRAQGIKAFFYTTASHAPDKPRWRGLFPFSREQPAHALDTYVARVNGVLGGVVSEESFNRSQAFFAGRVAGVVFDYRTVDGRCIDEIDGLPEIGRPGGSASGTSGVSGYSRESAYEDIEAGLNLHGAINHLAMIGEPREEIEAAMHASAAKGQDERRWKSRFDEIPRSIRGAERRRERDLQRRLASVAPPPRQEGPGIAPRASVFETITAASLAGKPIPGQKWLAPDLIPAGQPVLLSGDGGLGKSLLALQLGVSVATGGRWLGHFTAQGSVLYLSAEDEVAELHRRLERICCDLSKLHALHIAPMAELDALLVAPVDRRLATTALYDAVAARVEEIRPALVVLDSNADFFGGNEVVRYEVRWFIGQLRKLCHSTGCCVLILSHPSVSGMQSGSGLSGSTHWNNSVRARLYLTKSTDDEADPDERTLEVMKNNRGPLGKRVTIRWNAGAFVPVDGFDDNADPSAPKVSIDDKADAVFLELLRQRRRHNINVTYASAAKVFSDTPGAKGSRLTKRHMAAALNRLVVCGAVEVFDYKNNGRVAKHLRPCEPRVE